MNRRNFLAAVGVVSLAPVLPKQSAEVRYIMFNPPRESYAIYWMHGHVATEKFMSIYSQIIETPIHPSNVKQGWASFKLSRIGLYLSDRPLENFEPITYWIPADQAEMEITV